MKQSVSDALGLHTVHILSCAAPFVTHLLVSLLTPNVIIHAATLRESMDPHLAEEEAIALPALHGHFTPAEMKPVFDKVRWTRV